MFREPDPRMATNRRGSKLSRRRTTGEGDETNPVSAMERSKTRTAPSISGKGEQKRSPNLEQGSRIRRPVEAAALCFAPAHPKN